MDMGMNSALDLCMAVCMWTFGCGWGGCYVSGLACRAGLLVARRQHMWSLPMVGLPERVCMLLHMHTHVLYMSIGMHTRCLWWAWLW